MSDLCPACGSRVKALEDWMPGQKAAARKALAVLPKKVRAFYAPQYRTDDYTGMFVGLACKVCYRWSDCGHVDNCPVGMLA